MHAIRIVYRVRIVGGELRDEVGRLDRHVRAGSRSRRPPGSTSANWPGGRCGSCRSSTPAR